MEIETNQILSVKRITYGNNENQFGDLRLPDGNGPFPVAMIIHGGFWRSQFNLEQMNKLAEAFTAQGIATWNIEYRRVGQDGGGWPGTFLDNAKAIDFLDGLAKSYSLDLTKVITVGHSAGGHLALWLAARDKLPMTSTIHTKIAPFELQGAISLAGVADLRLMHEIHEWKETLFGIVDNPTRDLLAGTPEEQNSRYQEGSPQELLPIGKSLALIHGSLDVNVPIGLSEKFAEKAEASGDTVILKTIPNVEHFGLIQPDSESWPIILKTAKMFLS